MGWQGTAMGQLISLMQHLGHPDHDAARASATEPVPDELDKNQGGWDGQFLKTGISEHRLAFEPKWPEAILLCKNARMTIGSRA